MDVEVVREAKNFRGSVFSALLGLIGRRLIGGQIRSLLRGLEQTQPNR